MACQYARAFLSAGHEVVAVCGPRPTRLPSVIDALREAGAKVCELDGFYELLNIPLIQKVARIVTKERADVIISTLQADVKVATGAGALSHTPVVAFIQNAHTFGGGPVTRRLKEATYGFALRRLSRIAVCLSNSLKDELAERFGVRPEHVAILANGIDANAYPPLDPLGRAETRKNLGLRGAVFLLINVGRFDEQKGQLVLLDAFRKVVETLPGARLLLVGSATETRESAAYARRMEKFIEANQLQDRVLMPGWRADVTGLLYAADLYIHSALWEGGPLPLAMLEAMAARLPVIGTDCAGIPEGFVHGEHGIIVNAGDAGALADAIETLAAAGAAKRAELARNARCLVEQHYDLQAANKRFVELICTATGIRQTQSKRNSIP